MRHATSWGWFACPKATRNIETKKRTPATAFAASVVSLMRVPQSSRRWANPFNRKRHRRCGAKQPNPSRTRSRLVPQDEVNRLVTLATRPQAEQPIFSVDRYLIRANLKASANWPRPRFFIVWTTQKRRNLLAPFSQFLLGLSQILKRLLA